MNYYIISDTHFGHEKIHDFCGRPKGFEKTILDNIVKTLYCHPRGSESVVVHLGDFSWSNHNYWATDYVMACDKAKKVLVLGNHDKNSKSWYYKMGFDFVCDRFDLHLYGKDIIFTHKPVEITTQINIHGHFHNLTEDRWEPELKSILTPNHRLVSIEKQFSLIELRKII